MVHSRTQSERKKLIQNSHSCFSVQSSHTYAETSTPKNTLDAYSYTDGHMPTPHPCQPQILNHKIFVLGYVVLTYASLHKEQQPGRQTDSTKIKVKASNSKRLALTVQTQVKKKLMHTWTTDKRLVSIVPAHRTEDRHTVPTPVTPTPQK